MSEKDEHKIEYFGSASKGYGWRCTCGYGMKPTHVRWAGEFISGLVARAVDHLLDEGIVPHELRSVLPDGVEPREDKKRRIHVKWR